MRIQPVGQANVAHQDTRTLSGGSWQRHEGDMPWKRYQHYWTWNARWYRCNENIKFGFWAMYYYSDLTLSQSFQAVAALPLARSRVTASRRRQSPCTTRGNTTGQEWNPFRSSRVGLVEAILSFLFSRFYLKSLKRRLLDEYPIHIWQVSPQLSCDDTCHISTNVGVIALVSMKWPWNDLNKIDHHQSLITANLIIDCVCRIVDFHIIKTPVLGC